MMIQKIYSAPSFGKKLVGEFNVNKKELFGSESKVPVQIWRLETEEDFEEAFSFERIKNINMDLLLHNKRPEGPWTYDYIVTPKDSQRILGAADCTKYDDCLEIETIGTSKNKNYSGIGRALIAGIVQDIQGKIKQIDIPFPLEQSLGFYSKCHFNYGGTVSGFSLPEEKYNDVINDARNQ